MEITRSCTRYGVRRWATLSSQIYVPSASPSALSPGTSQRAIGRGSVRLKALLSDDLLDTARRLAQGVGGQAPTQADLCRAVSGVYYAAFHAICQSNADTLVGDDPQDRDQEAWHQAYRALEHRYANRRCRQVQSNPRFARPIQVLARRLPDFQSRRHRADYNPENSLTQQEVLAAVSQVEDVIANFQAVPEQERRAFAIYILMRE